MDINAYPLIRGLASYVLPRKVFERPGSGGTFSSSYCYSVWLRHICSLMENGLFNSVDEIKCIAEIGPGDSLGIGMSSLYSGANKYYAFDVLPHTNTATNLSVNDELYELFSGASEIPNSQRYKNVYPALSSYNFPKFLRELDVAYYRQRQVDIRKALANDPSSAVTMEYIVPWQTSTRGDIEQIDLIFSQAVMEHVADIEYAYNKMYKWLRSGGVVSHQIDFQTHEITKKWNGHWYINDLTWKVLAHGRKYPINRLPLSVHLRTMEAAGFEIRNVSPVKRPNAFSPTTPETASVKYTAEDLVTCGALVQATK